MTDPATGCGALVEAPDAATAVRTYWRRYRPALAPAGPPDGLRVLPVADEEGDLTMRLDSLTKRVAALEGQRPTGLRIIADYTTPDGTVRHRVLYTVNADGTVDRAELPVDRDAAAAGIPG